jgi:hypothetical protein
MSHSRNFGNPDLAARKPVEIANDVEAVMDGRIYIERVNAPFLAVGGSGEDFRAGIERAVALGRLWRHEQDDMPGRPEAIRRLVELGLRAKTK